MQRYTPAEMAKFNAQDAIKGEHWRRRFEAYADAVRKGEVTYERESTSSRSYRRPPRPAWSFLYGSLAESDLSQVVGMDKVETFPAYVKNQSIRYWKRREVLCDGEEKINGILWYAPSNHASQKLREYMTEAYMEYWIKAKREDNARLVIVKTFFWSNDAAHESSLPHEPTD